MGRRLRHGLRYKRGVLAVTLNYLPATILATINTATLSGLPLFLYEVDVTPGMENIKLFEINDRFTGCTTAPRGANVDSRLVL
ncbi:hypothetical protein F4802DRAFT_221580 [Xylaria palmicola]|nr:hypothetical protein F4802DRAFT_221580 [Xylaria palmicola]